MGSHLDRIREYDRGTMSPMDGMGSQRGCEGALDQIQLEACVKREEDPL